MRAIWRHRLLAVTACFSVVAPYGLSGTADNIPPVKTSLKAVQIFASLATQAKWEAVELTATAMGASRRAQCMSSTLLSRRSLQTRLFRKVVRTDASGYIRTFAVFSQPRQRPRHPPLFLKRLHFPKKFIVKNCPFWDPIGLQVLFYVFRILE
jgi:hypothetical protein